MNWLEAARAVQAAIAREDIVICSLGSVNRSWRAVEPVQASYYCSDPMGLSVSIALGMALARPDRRVICLCGDGDLAMSLAALGTSAGSGATNLRIILFNNRRYETGGGQPLAYPGMDFAAIARGAGIGWAEEADEATLPALLAGLLDAARLGFLAIPIDRESFGYAAPPDVSQAEERALFMRALAAA